jgi:hypothetical protein
MEQGVNVAALVTYVRAVLPSPAESPGSLDISRSFRRSPQKVIRDSTELRGCNCLVDPMAGRARRRPWTPPRGLVGLTRARRGRGRSAARSSRRRTSGPRR